MSELKAYKPYVNRDGDMFIYHKGDEDLMLDDEDEIYLKDDADKVIEDIIKGTISMFRESSCCRGLDLKSSLGRIADVAFKHWNYVERVMSNNRLLSLDKANLLRSNENLHLKLKSQILGRQNDKIEYALNIRHHKYKRCLAMAERCKDKIENVVQYNEHDDWLIITEY